MIFAHGRERGKMKRREKRSVLIGGSMEERRNWMDKMSGQCMRGGRRKLVVSALASALTLNSTGSPFGFALAFECGTGRVL